MSDGPPQEPTDEELGKVYDDAFREIVSMNQHKIWTPHFAGLRALYRRGRDDAQRSD